MISEKKMIENDKIFILLAPGFEEGIVIYCLAHLREAGLPVSLVGLTSGMVRGQHGLMVRPDQTVARAASTKPRIVLIPGGRQCLAGLSADPRIHELLEATVYNEGRIAAAMKSQELISSNGFAALIDSGYFISQENQTVETFADQLLALGQVYD
ncbi:MAG: DJ-1/PfpI family protein [Candidatus Promineifilaceae bacterium]